MHFILFMRGATAYEGQIGRVCYRLPYWRFLRVGCWPSLYLAPKEPEEIPPGTYEATITDVQVDERTERVKYNAQLGLFDDPSDKWGTLVRANEAPPYEGY